MTGLNGDIECDPWMHGVYDDASPNSGAPISFAHGGTGITRMEAIDILLHDTMTYDAYQTATSFQNGQFYMAAFDSILTRGVGYINPTDTGSVFITSDKLKYTASGICPNINDGHIVLGYACSDVIRFDYSGNPATVGANVSIKASYAGFANNTNNTKDDANEVKPIKGNFGGNITFDRIEANMVPGNKISGGYMEISTPNGNIWGKDSMIYNAFNGDLLVDAGKGSYDDSCAIRWAGYNNSPDMLDTRVPDLCKSSALFRTGNIMMKGGTLNFGDSGNMGTGNATFRTREGYIDTYDAFTIDSMGGHLLKYAGAENATTAAANNWGSVAERDFAFTASGGSVFYGADNNLYFNYGDNNGSASPTYGGRGAYDELCGVTLNPFHSSVSNVATYSVTGTGFLFYRDWDLSANAYHVNGHVLYRGGNGKGDAGECETLDNGARDFIVDFRTQSTGGFGAVASNYVDFFTRFEYKGGSGSGMHTVPGMTTLHGESVSGYGLYIKSQFNGIDTNFPEKRRATCWDCEDGDPLLGDLDGEWPAITFHDEMRDTTENMRSYMEAPIIEFFGHAEFNTVDNNTGSGKITLKADSLIFHDSVIFNGLYGSQIEFLPFTTDPAKRAAMQSNGLRYGVVVDDDENGGDASYENYFGMDPIYFGPVIEMEDRMLPVIELGYQRCVVPPTTAQKSSNRVEGHNGVNVGGDVIVSFRNGYVAPIFNTIVANHARISFTSDSHDGGVQDGEYPHSFLRTDLLRIRNKVEFYSDNSSQAGCNTTLTRVGTLVMTSPEQWPTLNESGIYPRHLHLEPGSELSVPGEDTIKVISQTTVGGYGHLHENVWVGAGGIIAPGHASLMETDCQNMNYATPASPRSMEVETRAGIVKDTCTQGTLTLHNLHMEKDAVLRVSIGMAADGTTFVDNLKVLDSIILEGKINVVVLFDPSDKVGGVGGAVDYLEDGCYTMVDFGDVEGLSGEYVKNFELKNKRVGDRYLSLAFEDEQVLLCISSAEMPVVQRRVTLPDATDRGITTQPLAGEHYVRASQNFTFQATYGNGGPYKVTALGYYSGNIVGVGTDVDARLTMTHVTGNTYEYKIRQVVEPWTITFGDELEDLSGVSNESINGVRVWSHKNTLYFNVDVADIANVYTMTGVLYKQVELPAGQSSLELERGVYVITMKDGTVHKITIK